MKLTRGKDRSLKSFEPLAYRHRSTPASYDEVMAYIDAVAGYTPPQQVARELIDCPEKIEETDPVSIQGRYAPEVRGWHLDPLKALWDGENIAWDWGLDALPTVNVYDHTSGLWVGKRRAARAVQWIDAIWGWCDPSGPRTRVQSVMGTLPDGSQAYMPAVLIADPAPFVSLPSPLLIRMWEMFKIDRQTHGGGALSEDLWRWLGYDTPPLPDGLTIFRGDDAAYALPPDPR